MCVTANKEIREAAKCAGVRLWQVAESIGVTDATFSRKLRRELPPQERDHILGVIQGLAAENAEAS